MAAAMLRVVGRLFDLRRAWVAQRSQRWRSRIVGTADVPPDQLVPSELNFRRHPGEQQDALSGLIDEIGYLSPVLVQQGTDRVIDGHLRVELAMRTNQPTIPVQYVDLTDDEANLALATIDPVSAMAYHDAANLRDLIGLIETDNADVQALLDSLAPDVEIVVDELTDPDAVPSVPDEPVTKLGDLWLLGRHRLGCIDSTDVIAVDRLTKGRTFDLLMIDPPYGIDAPHMTLGIGRRQFHRGEWDGNRIDVASFFGLAEHACIWGGNYYADVLPVTNDWLAWHKKNDDRSFSEFELAWTDYGCNTRIISHHWSGEVKEHPTQKPLEVILWAIEKAPASGTVIDLFGGSGTTLIACEQTGRTCVIADNDPRYCDVIVRRWEQFTGQTATLATEAVAA